MAYTEEEKNDLCQKILTKISLGNSVRKILKQRGMPSRDTFYGWLNDDKELSDRYARACEVRAEGIFDEIIEIAENSKQDHTPFTGINVIKRDTLRIDARKWILGKMQPTKYGEKLDVTSKGEKIDLPPSSIKVEIVRPDFND